MKRAGEVRVDDKVITEACCEWCGITNKMWASYYGKTHVKDLWNGEVYKYNGKRIELDKTVSWHLSDWAGDDGRKIVLTIAHILPDKMNCEDSNLVALCQRCHLNYDREHHMKNARETRNKKKKQIPLF